MRAMRGRFRATMAHLFMTERTYRVFVFSISIINARLAEHFRPTEVRVRSRADHAENYAPDYLQLPIKRGRTIAAN